MSRDGFFIYRNAEVLAAFSRQRSSRLIAAGVRTREEAGGFFWLHRIGAVALRPALRSLPNRAARRQQAGLVWRAPDSPTPMGGGR